MKIDRNNKENRVRRKNIAGGVKRSRERAELIRGMKEDFLSYSRVHSFSRCCKLRLYSASKLHKKK